jgi:hypothetical protein
MCFLPFSISETRSMSINALSKTLAGALLLCCGALPLATVAATVPDPVASRLSAEEQQVGVATFTASSYKPGTHIVLVRFRHGVSEVQRHSTVEKFMALEKQSLRDGKPYIQSIETGPQTSGEGASHGLQQAFILTFASEGDRNYFIGTPIVSDPQHYEPAHAAFKQIFKPVLAKDGLVSFDFPVTQAGR